MMMIFRTTRFRLAMILWTLIVFRRFRLLHTNHQTLHLEHHSSNNTFTLTCSMSWMINVASRLSCIIFHSSTDKLKIEVIYPTSIFSYLTLACQLFGDLLDKPHGDLCGTILLTVICPSPLPRIPSAFSVWLTLHDL